MFDQGPFDNDNSQFVVSYELLQLFRWLFENEQESLKKLIEKALLNGLNDKLITLSSNKNNHSNHELQQSIVDFFALLETILYEITNENEVKKVVERNLIPAIDHIDSSVCDNKTVNSSVARAATLCQNNPNENPKEILCKELLKRWKPNKKITLN